MIFNNNKNIFGLDISDQSLRLVQFVKKGKKIVLASYNDIKIPPNIIKNGEIQQEDKLIAPIKQLIKSANGGKVTTKNVVAVLPETKTFIKVIEIHTRKEDDEISKLVEEEIKNHIPLSPEEIYLDWQILEEKSNSKKLLIGAAPKRIVDSYVLALEKSGLTPWVMEIEAAAISRGLIPKNDNQAKIIIDFGATRTGLIVYDKQAPQFAVSLPISGNEITKTIAETLKLDSAKAEKSKIVCGLSPEKCEGALLKILLKPIETLAEQIQKSVAFYKTSFPESSPISEIILCGGGANFSKIDKVLAEKLKIPVKVGNPLANAAQTKKLGIPQNKILSYSTAIGLALRAWEK